jgi:hypothetical protein
LDTLVSLQSYAAQEENGENGKLSRYVLGALRQVCDDEASYYLKDK